MPPPEPTNIPPPERGGWAALAGALLLALFLGTWGLDWGLPNDDHFFSYHGGESRAVGIALQMDIGSGDLAPRWRDKPYFAWGSHSLYAFFAANLVADGLGLVETGREPAEWVRADYARAHLVSRGVSVAYSLATVIAIFLIARRWYGLATARLAALATAICPLLVYEARFATVNACLTFWCVLAVGAWSRATRRASATRFLIAGLATGLAVAAKLSALPLFAVALAALLLAAFRERAGVKRVLGWGACGLVGSAAGFLALTPYALVHWSDFIAKAFGELVEHSRWGHGILFVDTGSGLGYLFGTNLPVSLSWPLWSLAIAGLCLAGVRVVHGLRFGGWRKAASPWEASLFCCVWLGVNIAGLATAEVRFPRYLMPLCPFFCLLAARTAETALRVAPRPRGRRVLGAILTLLLAWIGAYSLVNVLPFGRPDPKDAVLAWFRENVPAGTTVGFVNRPASHLAAPVYPAASDPFRREPERESWTPVVLGGDPDVLDERRPAFVLVNKLEVREEQRIDPESPSLDDAGRRRVHNVRALLALLERDYTRAAPPFENRPELGPFSFVWKMPPRGWSAATQTIEVWRRR